MTGSTRAILAPLLFAAAASVAGCNQAPSGDVAATVNGEPIARTDLAIETQGAGTGGGDSTAQQAVLGDVVDRKLLAQEAVARKLDATPEFKAAERRARETALAAALLRKLAGDKPNEAALARFKAENPAMFAGREMLTLDQLQAPAAAVDGAWLRSAQTLAQAASVLQAHHVPFERGSASADTAMMPPQLIKLLATHPTEPFILPQGDKIVISQVAGRQRAPLPPEQADAVANGAMMRRAMEQSAATTLTGLRAKAKISYGKGFTAPAPASPAATR